VLLFGALLTACAGHRVITGAVTDHRGAAMDRAIVRLSPGDLEIMTDREGHFLIDFLRDGDERMHVTPRTSYTLDVFKPGYHVVETTFFYTRGQQILDNITLVPDVLRVQDDGEDLVPTLDDDHTTSGGATYEGQ